MITEVALTPANTPDRDAVDDLLAADTTPGSGDHDNEPDPSSLPGALEIFGDSAYADGATLDRLAEAGHTVVAKVPPVRNRGGLFTKDQFSVDLPNSSVTCPAGNTVAITAARRGDARGPVTDMSHLQGTGDSATQARLAEQPIGRLDQELGIVWAVELRHRTTIPGGYESPTSRPRSSGRGRRPACRVRGRCGRRA